MPRPLAGLPPSIALIPLLLCAFPAFAQTVAAPDIAGPDVPPALEDSNQAPNTDLPGDGTNAASPPGQASDPAPKAQPLFPYLIQEIDRFTLVSQTKKLSFHKPMFIAPLTWAPDYEGSHSEVLFAISFKLRLLNRNLFFGYTQRSFWQLFDSESSRPFRETNYNPELFYRYKFEWEDNAGLGFDIGIDHESNGKDIPESRSWNRIVGAVFYETSDRLIHLRTWYRLPEDEDRAPDDPKRDDNPDIYQYYGYTELRLQQKLFGERKHMASLMLRGNPSTGHGAIELTYSAPAPFSNDLFWMAYVWNGYGESLGDYNHSVTRVGVGVMLAR